MSKIWFLYMVRCSKGALYTGISPDVQARVAAHNTGKGARAVKALGLPVELVYKERIGSKGSALKRELEVKRMSKKQKENLILEGHMT